MTDEQFAAFVRRLDELRTAVAGLATRVQQLEAQLEAQVKQLLEGL